MKRHFMTKQHKRAEYEPLTVLFEAAKKSRSEHETKFHCKRLEKRTRKKTVVQLSTLLAGLRPCEGLNGSSSKDEIINSIKMHDGLIPYNTYQPFAEPQAQKKNREIQNRAFQDTSRQCKSAARRWPCEGLDSSKPRMRHFTTDNFTTEEIITSFSQGLRPKAQDRKHHI